MFKNIDIKNLNENPVELIGDKWMLIGAGDKNNFNAMTANWGGLGFLWNKPVAFVFIRPQRYTFGFTEKFETMSLSFFDEKYRKALNICGTKSGRDSNKIAEAGLSPIFTDFGNPTFQEADLVIECKKLYAQTLTEDSFIDKTLVEKWYPKKDFHKVYAVEILNVLKRDV